MSMMEFKGPGFRMQVPTDWYITSNPQIQAMFMAPPSSGKIRANLMITLRPLAQGAELIDIARLALDAQQREYTDFKLLEEKVCENHDHGIDRLYEWYQSEHKVKVLQRQVLLKQNEVLYTITATRSDEAEVERFDLTFDHMIQTFIFE